MWKEKNIHASQQNMPQTWDIINQANDKIPPSSQNIKHCELKLCVYQPKLKPVAFVAYYGQFADIVLPS